LARSLRTRSDLDKTPGHPRAEPLYSAPKPRRGVPSCLIDTVPSSRGKRECRPDVMLNCLRSALEIARYASSFQLPAARPPAAGEGITDYLDHARGKCLHSPCFQFRVPC